MENITNKTELNENPSKEDILHWLNFCVEGGLKEMKKYKLKLYIVHAISIIVYIGLIYLQLHFKNLWITLPTLLLLILAHMIIRTDIKITLSCASVSYMFSQMQIDEINGKCRTDFKEFSSAVGVPPENLEYINEILQATELDKLNGA